VYPSPALNGTQETVVVVVFSVGDEPEKEIIPGKCPQKLV
jgi:hypothetical protein